MKAISCVLTCYNEAHRIAKAVDDYCAAIRESGMFSSFEFIIVDDGSSDGTALEIAALANKYPWVKPIYHKKNRGIGSAYKSGLRHSSSEFVLLGFGDAPNLRKDLVSFFKAVGAADVIMSYVINLHQIHGPGRYLLSRCFTWLLNTTCGRNINYYNGVGIYRRADLERISIFSSRFAVHAEIATKLMSLGCSVKQVGMRQNYRGKKSSALRPKSVYAVGKTLMHLSWFQLFQRKERHYVLKAK